MSASAKRPWFQIHLSTAVVLMFVAGVFLWLQCELRTTDLAEVECGGNLIPHYGVTEVRGWPFALYGRGVILNPVSDGAPNYSKRTYTSPIHLWADPSFISLPELIAYNAIASLTCIAAVGVFLEFLIRRKKRIS